MQNKIVFRSGSMHQPTRRIRAGMSRRFIIIACVPPDHRRHANPNLLFRQKIASGQRLCAFRAALQVHDLLCGVDTPNASLTRDNSSATTPRIRLQISAVGQIFDSSSHLFVFGLDLFAFERGQPPQLQIKDRVSLQLRQLVALHQFGSRRFNVRCAADELDNLIQIL